MTIVTIEVIFNVHFAAVVHPQLTHDDIVHCRGDFTPRVVVTSLVK